MSMVVNITGILFAGMIAYVAYRFFLSVMDQK